jgi:hypothetical protein
LVWRHGSGFILYLWWNMEPRDEISLLTLVML